MNTLHLLQANTKFPKTHVRLSSEEESPPMFTVHIFQQGRVSFQRREAHQRSTSTFGYFALQLVEQLPVARIKRQLPVMELFFSFKGLDLAVNADFIEDQMKRVVSPVWSLGVV
ncbi:hypothetical protein OIU78_020557 [Salix suchowensis]|nr:hypothetical protein OIU78_020557 [Salix suchowensis]